MKRCHHCQTVWTGLVQPHFREQCTCGLSLHACRNCRHHDGSARYECRANVEDRVADKTAFNLCEWFQFADSEPSTKSDAEKRAEARKKLGGLFS